MSLFIIHQRFSTIIYLHFYRNLCLCHTCWPQLNTADLRKILLTLSQYWLNFDWYINSCSVRIKEYISITKSTFHRFHMFNDLREEKSFACRYSFCFHFVVCRFLLSNWNFQKLSIWITNWIQIRLWGHKTWVQSQTQSKTQWLAACRHVSVKSEYLLSKLFSIFHGLR